jgi:FixJ family two-component response regulator
VEDEIRPESKEAVDLLDALGTDEGLRAAESIRAEHGTSVGILVLSQHVEPPFAMRLVSDGAGGVGYLLKDRITDLDDFADAIRRIAKGGSAIDPAVVAVLVGRRSRVPLDDLTERERTVLALMAEGRSNQAIADRLSMARKTVEGPISRTSSPSSSSCRLRTTTGACLRCSHTCKGPEKRRPDAVAAFPGLMQIFSNPLNRLAPRVTIQGLGPYEGARDVLFQVAIGIVVTFVVAIIALVVPEVVAKHHDASELHGARPPVITTHAVRPPPSSV